ncbi:MAG TPA: trypsin-like peptidase domain-containing protein [Thermoanaerobaculia bacterium]|nr:trypsin-like peptidase domain-containing protein [Thermoanaerobaculia bacterium]
MFEYEVRTEITHVYQNLHLLDDGPSVQVPRTLPRIVRRLLGRLRRLEQQAGYSGKAMREGILAEGDPRQASIRAAVAVVSKPTRLGNGKWKLKTSGTFAENYYVCETDPFALQQAIAGCGGALVGPNVVLTAGHCVEPKPKPNWFAFGVDVSRAPDFILEPKEVVMGVVEEEIPSRDLAIVKLAERIPRSIALHVMMRPENGSTSEELFLVGYPWSLPRKVVDGRLLKAGESSFQATLDSNKSSGGAVYGSDFVLEGMHTKFGCDLITVNRCKVPVSCPGGQCTGVRVGRVPGSVQVRVAQLAFGAYQ